MNKCYYCFNLQYLSFFLDFFINLIIGGSTRFWT